MIEEAEIVIKGRRHQPETIDITKIAAVAQFQQIEVAGIEIAVLPQVHALLHEVHLPVHDYLLVDDHLAGELLLSADSLLVLDQQRKVAATE